MKKNEYLVRKVKINCDDKNIDISDIDAFIKQKPNKKTLFVLRFHLSVYNRFHKKERREPKKKIKKWFTYSIPQWIETVVGEPPVIFDEYQTDKSVKQMKLYLRNKGHYHAIVGDSISAYKHRRKEKRRKQGQRVKVIYNITTNQPYTIQNVVYVPEYRKSHYIDSLMNSNFENTLLKKEDNFDIDVLQQERQRITTYLRNKGYYGFVKEYIHFKVDSTVGERQVNIKIMVKQKLHKTDGGKAVIETDHSLYRINHVNVYPAFDPKEALKLQARYFENHDTLTFDRLKGYSFFVKDDVIKINPKVVGSSLLIDSSNIYRQSDVEKTYKRLSAIRTFKLVNINFTELPDTGKQKLLDCNIQLSHSIKQSLSLEFEGSNFSANAGAASNVVYRNKNFLRGAEFFELKIRTSLEADPDYLITGNSRFNTFETGFVGTLYIPKFMLPFNLINFERRFAPHTTISLSYSYEQSPKITWIKRNATFGYFLQSSDYGKHQINIIDFNSVKVPADKLSSDHRLMLDTTYGKYSYESHLVSAFSYSYVFNNQARKGKKNLMYFKMNLKAAGNILSGFNMIFNDLKISEGEYSLFNMQYAQFLKSDFDIRLYHSFTSKQKIVFRTFAGAVVPYGNLKSVPYKQRYYSGGANSVRAWKTKDLGPGAFNSVSTENPSIVADVKLEGNVEYRSKMNKMLELALFVDAGNIWDINETEERPKSSFSIQDFYKQLAVGSGIGLRIDLSFFIIRLDWAIKLHDPALEVNEKWLWEHDLGLRSELNFGIGYPF